MDNRDRLQDLRSWRSSLDAIGEAVIITDLDGTVTFWNAAAERLYGWSEAEAVGASVVELVPSAASRSEAENIMRRLVRGETWHGRFEVRRRDGTNFPALVTDAPLLDEHGELTGIIGISVDLTDQVEAEARARRGQLQSAVAELAGMALHALSLDPLFDRAVRIVADELDVPLVLIGEYAASGDRLRPLAGVGWKPDVTDGLTLVSVRTQGEPLPVIVEDHTRAVTDSRPPLLVDHGVRSSVVVPIAGRPGAFGTLGVYDTAPRRFSSQGVAFLESVAGVLGGAVDRNHAEEELRGLARRLAGERRRYLELFELAPDPYLVTDRRGTIIHANRQACTLLGADAPEGSKLVDYVAADAVPEFGGYLHEAAESSEIVVLELVLAPRDRPRIVAEVDVTTGLGPEGRSVLRWVLRDVTETKHEQQALQEATAQVHEEVTHLRDVEQWKNVMLGAAAHDLRQPLSVIHMAAETMLRRPGLDDDTTEHLLESICDHATRAQTLLRSLLDLDRLTRGVVMAERAPTQLDDLVAEAIRELEVTDHPLTMDLTPMRAFVDPGQIMQVVANLVGNAAQHTPAGTPVDVVLRRRDDSALLIVEDAGPGLPDLTPEAMFAPFTTASRHEGDVAGTGLGLSLVRLYARLHGGDVHADTRSEGGSRFTLELPQAILGDADGDGE